MIYRHQPITADGRGSINTLFCTRQHFPAEVLLVGAIPTSSSGGGKEDEEKHGLNINHQSKPIKASRLQKGTERGEEVRKGVEVGTGKK